MMIGALNNLCWKPHTTDAGVSNFDLSELKELWLMADVKPAVVQRNSDPLKPDTLVLHYARLTGMQYQVGISALWAHIFTYMDDMHHTSSTPTIVSKCLQGPNILGKVKGYDVIRYACLVKQANYCTCLAGILAVHYFA